MQRFHSHVMGMGMRIACRTNDRYENVTAKSRGRLCIRISMEALRRNLPRHAQ